MEVRPWHEIQRVSLTDLLLLSMTGALDSIAALDDIGLQAYRARPTMKLEEQPTGVAQDGSDLVPAPEGSR